MRLADDDRARVPFALVAVILLVGSASYAATLSHQPAPASRPDAVAAMNRLDGGIETAVHKGTKRAAGAAARAPVLEPANSSGGNVLDESDTFRDYLRIRIYLAVREDLESTVVTIGAVRAVASLSETPNARALREAKRRVDLTRIDGGLRVRLDDVTIRLERHGRVIDRRTRSVVRTVATPVLDLHERVQRYERRIDRGPTDGAGLGRRLTARTNAIAWTRGYAQYGGAPISNVVANRHVELMTNGALLGTQRAVFGRSDAAGRRATARATAIVGGTDVLMAGQGSVDTIRAVPRRPGRPTGPAPPGLPEPTRPPSAQRENVTIQVGLTADRAFASFVSGRGDTTLENVVADVYGADVKPAGASRVIGSVRDPPARPSGSNWTVDEERTTRTATVHPATAEGPPVRVDDGWHRLETETRRVVVTEMTIRRWARWNGTDREERVTSRTTIRTHRVTVALLGRHAVTEFAPERPIDTVHERGGPLHGPNLREIPEAGNERIEQRLGTTDELARQIVAGGLDPETVWVPGERPPGLDDWLYEDLASLRNTVSDLSETVPRTRIGTGEVNPAAVLVERLRNQRRSLVDAPGTYGSVADKARTSVRSAYLATVVARLEERAAAFRATRSRFDESLGDHGVDRGVLSASLGVGASVERPAVRPVVSGGPLGPMNASVVASPAYLTLSRVTHDRVPTVPPHERYHPLAARNTNLFTLPYGDAADGVVSHLFGDEDRTGLRSAGRALRSANRTLERRHDPDLVHRRNELQSAVVESLAFVRARLVAALATTDGLTPAERRAAVREGAGRWATTDGRALAAANGSLATAVATAAADRLDDRSDRRRDWVAVRLRTTLAQARDRERARPKQPDVERSSSVTRDVTEQVVATTIARGTNATASAVQRKLDGDVVYPPAGLPVTPFPGYWYATTNVWTVTVRGAYVRFAVSVPGGRPGRDITYVRERGRVALDWDGDGAEELLGRSTRISFDVSTAAVVVVPPGGPGVGDRDGNADERSDGWSGPAGSVPGVTTTSTRGL